MSLTCTSRACSGTRRHRTCPCPRTRPCRCRRCRSRPTCSLAGRHIWSYRVCSCRYRVVGKFPRFWIQKLVVKRQAKKFCVWWEKVDVEISVALWKSQISQIWLFWKKFPEKKRFCNFIHFIYNCIFANFRWKFCLFNMHLWPNLDLKLYLTLQPGFVGQLR